MNQYAQEPWEGSKVAQASETGHFIKGKSWFKMKYSGNSDPTKFLLSRSDGP